MIMSPLLSVVVLAWAGVQGPVVPADGTRTSGEPITPELVARYVAAFPEIARISADAAETAPPTRAPPRAAREGGG